MMVVLLLLLMLWWPGTMCWVMMVLMKWELLAHLTRSRRSVMIVADCLLGHLRVGGSVRRSRCRCWKTRHALRVVMLLPKLLLMASGEVMLMLNVLLLVRRLVVHCLLIPSTTMVWSLLLVSWSMMRLKTTITVRGRCTSCSLTLRTTIVVRAIAVIYTVGALIVGS